MTTRPAFLGRDMAVDLGTATTVVYLRGRGIVLNEPSVVALNTSTGRIVAVGAEAKEMIGRTPEGVTAVRPLEDGVIADSETTGRMLRYFVHKTHRRRHLTKPRLVVAVPGGITPAERRAVEEAGYRAGARRVRTIEKPVAAAIGAGLPVHEPTGAMVVDIGGGTTEVAVISMGGIVVSGSVRAGGDAFDRAVAAFVAEEHSLTVGERTAEELKKAVVWACPAKAEELRAEVRGRDLAGGLPRTVLLSAARVSEAVEEPVRAVVDAVRAVLDRCPPELAGDIMDRGIALTGGGALLRGLDERLRRETGMPVHVAENALDSVAVGAGTCVENYERLDRVLVPERRR